MITVTGVSHTYHVGSQPVRALDRIDLALPDGTVACLLGPSGSGKSTLLHLLGGIERCQVGEIVVDQWPLNRLDAGALARYRRQHVGFVFQAFHLLPMLTALENVEVPLVLAGVHPAERRRRARALLEQVGLADRAAHRPAQLSGGEQQRVAIARALVTEPRLVLADEPTGNLDSATGEQVVALLLAEQRARGCTVLLATHNEALARHAQQCLRLRDGRLVAEVAR
ncbi:MAG TPA: ABC transporter ATP-binding protein [Chloroflexota bacterium]|jgi:putative ABC transport system ATP-binding protein|nr:ABC transporter ATP-binding protein [Chloroflexota bacterium]